MNVVNRDLERNHLLMSMSSTFLARTQAPEIFCLGEKLQQQAFNLSAAYGCASWLSVGLFVALCQQRVPRL